MKSRLFYQIWKRDLLRWLAATGRSCSSLKNKLLRTRSIWSRTGAKKQNKNPQKQTHFRGYIDTSIWPQLNSGIKLMRLYWRTSYYKSHDVLDQAEERGGEEFIHFSWEDIMGKCICRPLTCKKNNCDPLIDPTS